MELLFNVLNTLILVGIALILFEIRCLSKYVLNASYWNLKIIGWSLFLVSRVLSSVNVAFFGGGLNWLSIVNTILVVGGIGCLVFSYRQMENALKKVLTVLVKKPLPIEVDKLDVA